MTSTVPISIPHWQFPVSISPVDGVATVEQDSTQEIETDVLSILSCQAGECAELPQFGFPDPTFQTAPLSMSAIAGAIQAQEPRATLQIVTKALDQMRDSWQAQITASASSALS